jgi:peptide/nickel transport system substrate-binding protein
VSHLRALGTPAQVNAVLKSLPKYPFSLAKAKAELAKSKYPNGFDATLDGFEYGSTLNVLQAIAGDLKKIGINMTVNDMTLGAWVQKVTGPRDKVGAILLTYGCISPDISYYPNVFLTSKNAKEGGFNTANYTPPAIDTLVAQAQKVSSADRLALYGKIMKMVLTDLPYYPILNLEAAYAAQPKFDWSRYSYFDALQGPWALDVRLK